MSKCSSEPKPKPRTFIDFVDAAKIAGYSTRHFRRFVDDGEIKYTQIGRKFWVLTADLDQWLATHGAKRENS